MVPSGQPASPGRAPLCPRSRTGDMARAELRRLSGHRSAAGAAEMARERLKPALLISHHPTESSVPIGRRLGQNRPHRGLIAQTVQTSKCFRCPPSARGPGPGSAA